MVQFTKTWFPLTDIQVSQFRGMCQTLTLSKVILLKTQIMTISNVEKQNYFMIPLTADQVVLLQQAQANKNDLELHFTYHQIKEVAKSNFGQEIDISNVTINHMTKKRIYN